MLASDDSSSEDGGRNGSGGDSSSDAGDGDDIHVDGLQEFPRMLLQSIQTLGIVNETQMKKLILLVGKKTNRNVKEEDVTSQFIQSKLETINTSIKPLNMIIRKVNCELGEEVLYMFHATIDNPAVMKFQTSLTPYEVELFKRSMDLILKKHKDFITPCDDLIELASAIELENKTMSQVKEMIKRLIKLKYLINVSPGEEVGEDNCKVTLGVRAVRELEPILQDMYKDLVSNCCLCKGILLHGLQCIKCNNVFHQHCFKTFIEATTTCPNAACKAELPILDEMPKRVRPNHFDDGEDEGDDTTVDMGTNGSTSTEEDDD